MDDDKSKTKSEVIGIRLTREEFKRFTIIVERAKSRNSLSDRAAVARELIGFPSVPQTVTDEDRQFLITGTTDVEVVTPGRLTPKQEGLLRKVKELLIHGHDENPESNLSAAVSSSVNALWIALKSRATTTRPKDKEKKSKKNPSSSHDRVDYEDEDGSRGDRPPPG